MIRFGRNALLLPALALVLAGCSGTPWVGSELDEWGWYACQDFGEAVQSAGGGSAFYAISSPERREVLDEVAPNFGRSAWPMAADTAAVLTRTVEANTEAWTLAADTAAARCLDAGWPDGVPGS